MGFRISDLSSEKIVLQTPTNQQFPVNPKSHCIGQIGRFGGHQIDANYYTVLTFQLLSCAASAYFGLE